MIFNPTVSGGDTGTKSITFSLTFNLSKMEWRAFYWPAEGEESTWITSDDNVSSLNNLHIQAGTPILVMINSQGTPIGYSGDGTSMSNLFNASFLWAIVPEGDGSGVFSMIL